MKTIDLGNIMVDRIVEKDAVWVDPTWLFKNMQQPMLDTHAEWMGPRLYRARENKLAISFHSYLVRSRGMNILVDTCNGNHKDRPGFPLAHKLKSDRYLNNLAACGLSPNDIHVVMCSHLHVDHVGWNTKPEGGRWVPTFPNARYVFSQAEFDHHISLQDATAEGTEIGYGSFADSILPIVDAGLADFVPTDFIISHEIGERIALEPSPGHTPGHVCMNLRGFRCEALLAGDVIHHPIQLREPTLVNAGDFDFNLARETRDTLLARCAENDTMLLTAHFPDPAVRIKRDGDIFELEFIS